MMKNIILLFLLMTPLLIYGQEYRVGDHELLFMPTAYTMNKGSAYFADYELFFLNFTYAPTSVTHLGVFTLFPVTDEFLETATFGLKQNLVHNPGIADAVWLTYTPKGSLFTIGNVLSAGKPTHGLHLAISTMTDLNQSNAEWFVVYMLGYRYDLSGKTSLLLEYMNAQILMDKVDFNGLLSIGIRFRSESVAWEIGGFRPLEDTGDLFLLPLIKGTFLF
jgi:hypothetical protein